MTQTSLGHRLRLLRAERQLSLRQAAALAGVVKETISDIERGVTHPQDVTLAKLAHAYEIPVDELLEEPVPLVEAPQESGPPQVSREDLEKLGITATDPELIELNNEMASYWHLWVHKDKTAYAYISEEDVDRNRVLMMMHLVLGTPDIVTPEAAGVVRQGMREKLKTG